MWLAGVDVVAGVGRDPGPAAWRLLTATSVAATAMTAIADASGISQPGQRRG
jgi:hypothetical protein